MLTIEEIKKALDTGNAVGLECVDVDMYCRTDSAFKNEREVIARSSLVITSIIGQGDFKALMISDCRYCIPENDLKHFRIKRSIPTFDDLIEVVRKAFEDKIVSEYREYRINDVPGIDFVIGGERLDAWELDSDSEARINLILSSYTETFVIGSVDDLRRIKVGANGVLSNGSTFKVESVSTLKLDWVSVKFGGSLSLVSETLGIDVLKGATATQSRGEK